MSSNDLLFGKKWAGLCNLVDKSGEPGDWSVGLRAHARWLWNI